MLDNCFVIILQEEMLLKDSRFSPKKIYESVININKHTFIDKSLFTHSVYQRQKFTKLKFEIMMMIVLSKCI